MQVYHQKDFFSWNFNFKHERARKTALNAMKENVHASSFYF